MGRMSDEEFEIARAAKGRKAGGAPSTIRRDTALLAKGKLVPRPRVMDLEEMARAIEEEEGPNADADAIAASIVVALRARGWTFQMISDRMGQPLERVRAWLTDGVATDSVAETEAFLDKFVLPAAVDLAHSAILAGDTSMAKDVLKGRGPLRKVLKEPGPRGGAITPSGPPVLNLQINVLPGTPGAMIAAGTVSGVPRGLEGAVVANVVGMDAPDPDA